MKIHSKALVYFIPGLDNPVAYQNIPNSVVGSVFHGVLSIPVNMVREDIAKKLYKALEAMTDDKVDDIDFNKMRNEALDAYREIK